MAIARIFQIYLKLINIREQDTARNKISKLLLINKYQSIRADYQVAIFNFDQ